MLTAPRLGRPPHQRDSLVADLRRRIISGELAPDSRVPTRQQLSRQFKTGNPTVNDALQCLIREGFVQARGARGTFVTHTPPHLCAYALVYPRLDVESRYFRALGSAAKTVLGCAPRRLHVYVSEWDQPSDPKNLRLIDDVTHHRLAGVILTWTGHEFNSSPLLAPDCPVPRVALHSDPARGVIPSVFIDWPAFFDRAVERLVAQGRRKIACLGIGDDDADQPEAREALRRRGLEYRRYWHLNIGPRCYNSARTAVHLLMSLAPADRPDGLIVADDNVVEPAQAGLVDAGVHVPRDLDLIAHCNWPEPPAAVFPLTRLGFDTTGMVRACAALLDEQRRGRAVSMFTRVEPLFEDEMPADSLAAPVGAAGPSAGRRRSAPVHSST